MRRDFEAMEAELAVLRELAERVRDHEREPCGGTVNRMRDALRAVDRASGLDSAAWMEAR
jgi:predicted hydrolase (HD superfamily)